MVGALLSLLF